MRITILLASVYLIFSAAGCGKSPVRQDGSVSSSGEVGVLSTRARVGFALDDVIVTTAALIQAAKSTGLTNDSDAWWAFVNQNDGRYSRLKKKTLEIIRNEIGKNSIIFVVISGRRNVEGKALASWIESVTGIPAGNVFFEKGNKAARMVDLRLDVFYGATDQDMEEALASGVKPVRILRAADSLDTRKATPGAYLEEIVPDSAE